MSTLRTGFLACALGSALAWTHFSAGLVWGRQTKVSQAGWISDESCATLHTKPGRADCVEKCWRGGASVGHPEWKPQRAVFITDKDRMIWIVENPEAVKNFPAAHVRVSGTFNPAKKMIRVEKIALL